VLFHLLFDPIQYIAEKAGTRLLLLRLISPCASRVENGREFADNDDGPHVCRLQKIILGDRPCCQETTRSRSFAVSFACDLHVAGGAFMMSLERLTRDLSQLREKPS